MCAVALALSLLSVLPASPAALPVTTGERTGFTSTGRYQESVALCRAIAVEDPRRARCLTWGTTPEGRELVMLVLSQDGVFGAQQARALKRPVVFAQGGIHAGEIDGKDAGFWIVKELLAGKVAPGALQAFTFVFVPVFNVDGHERMAPNNRPNQRGPAEMGWRVTSQNLNLNRDYTKADAPEMRAMLHLVDAYDPVLAMDLHVTDGAQFQHDVAVMVSPSLDGLPGLKEAALALQTDAVSMLKTQTFGAHLPLDFYPALEKDDEPASGFSVGVAPPRFSQSYVGTRNRLGMLVETHSWRPYPHRVKTTRDVLAAVLTLAKERATKWRAVEDAADAITTQGLPSVALAWENTSDKTTIDFLGYEYTRELSPVSGALRTRYDESRPQVWKVPFLPAVKPALVQQLPKAGYLIPPGYAALVKDRLLAHGLTLEEVSTARSVDAEVFRVSELKFSDKPYEGRMRLTPKGAWKRERRDVKAGSLFVPIKQPLGRLAASLFEPNAPDSFLQWGFFNSAFEQKEYMEGYVAEDVAAQMLKEPAVKAAFLAKLQSDAAFAGDASARLRFFYERHASFDKELDAYPVIRVDAWK
jgi:Zinc carboxypeptidase